MTIIISDHVLQQVKMRKAIIAQHEIIVHALEQEIMAMVQQSSGVDLVNEHWELDLDRGIMQRSDHEEKDCAP